MPKDMRVGGGRLTGVATMAGLILLAGCALSNAVPPTVDVMSLELTGIGLTEQRLAVALCVSNPNAAELAFRRVTADLDVSGAPLATGASELEVRLPGMASTVAPFTVVTTVRNLGPQLLGVLASGSLEYRIHGTVTLQGAFGITLPYARSGRLDPLAMGLGLASAAAEPAPPRCQAVAPKVTPGAGGTPL